MSAEKDETPCERLLTYLAEEIYSENNLEVVQKCEQIAEDTIEFTVHYKLRFKTQLFCYVE